MQHSLLSGWRPSDRCRWSPNAGNTDGQQIGLTAMTVTVIYGSDGGATESVAKRIAKRLDAKIVNITDATVQDFEDNTFLILGVPTYADGELQSDWEMHLDTLKSADITEKRVALFGLGDQEGYPASFLDAMGILYDLVIEQSATVVGFTDTAEFNYSRSMAEEDGKFVGLAIDEDSQPGMTSQRIKAWVEQLV